MSLKGKDLDPRNIVVIKEIYDSENAHEAFGDELERALEAGYELIIVEPHRLGDETARWITVGNCLHKSAVISGLGAIVCGFSWGKYPLSYMPLCVCSLFCTGLYMVSWQFDPCCKYQLCTDVDVLSTVPLLVPMTSASPIILMRKDDSKRKVLHTSITLLATVFCTYRLYSLVNN